MAGMDFPSSPTNGQTTTDGRYYFDSSVGSSGAWRSTPLPVGGLPAGSIMAWGTNTPPANWLLADGSAVSRSVYSSLFAVIGTQYGTGDGSSTFNLPDLRGRVPVGKNAATFGTLGATGGAENVTLTAAQSGIPAHSHPLTANSVASQGGGGFYWGMGADDYSRGLSVLGQPGGITVLNNTAQDASAPHSVLQPYQVVNYIIKASAGWTAGDSELATRIGVLEQNPNITGTLTVAGTTTHNGRVLAPNQPSFLATGSNSVFNLGAAQVYPFNTTAFNVGNGFNTTTNRFTAPVAGTYMFSFSIYVNSSSQAWPGFYKNGSQYTLNDAVVAYNGNTTSGVSMAIPMTLAANDYVQVVQRNVTATLTTYGGHSYFAGYLIG